MFKPPENVWRLREEDLPTSFRSSAAKAPLTWAGLFQHKSLVLLPISLVVASLWLIIQAYWLNLDYTVNFKADSLPKVPAGKLVVVPAPIQYSLLQTPPAPEAPQPPPLIALSKLPSPASSNIFPASFSPQAIPPELSKPVLPPPPETPTFKLVGIAQGSDGIVATLKIQDDASGIKDQLQDVREGSTASSGYIVSKITPDYVLIQNKKAGKTIRVE